jgi:hypothetical protein
VSRRCPEGRSNAPAFGGPRVGNPQRRNDLEALFDRILVVNLVASTVVFYAAARLYVLPKLSDWSFYSVMPPILLLHSLRHLGLMFLAPGVTHPGMPLQFAYPAALGDLLAALLAFAALVAVVRKHRAARALVWVFNVEGTLDLMAAIVLGTLFDAPRYMGAAYWITAFWVPALLVTHYITFLVLRRDRIGTT